MERLTFIERMQLVDMMLRRPGVPIMETAGEIMIFYANLDADVKVLAAGGSVAGLATNVVEFPKR